MTSDSDKTLHIYRASAGSGKTFRLAKDYIKMLLGRRDEHGKWHLRQKADGAHRHILAITFTNKATDEMKRRIIHELAVLAGVEPGWTEKSPYIDDLTALFGCSAHSLQSAAGHALKRLMFDFNFFNVSTIDSFFQTILRTFAREAELEGSYELELEGQTVVTEAVQRLFTRLSEEPDTDDTRRTVNLLATYMEEIARDSQSKADIFNRESGPYASLVKALSTLNNETLAINLDRLDSYYADPARIERFFAGVAAAAKRSKAAMAGTADGALSTISGMLGPETNKYISPHLLKILNKVAAGGDISGITLPKVAADGTAALKKEAKEQPWAGDIAAVSRDAAAEILRLYRQGIFLKSLAERRLTMMLISGVLAGIRERRGEINALLLSDTNSLLRDIIGDDDAPFVYERMGRWYNHFLIDEFQDTSSLQWSNLRPLLAEGLSSGNESLIIGDEKQCIYRFRNSDPELLGHTVESDFSGRVKAEPARPADDEDSDPEAKARMEEERRRVNTNWRSAATVVRFNNSLFRAMAEECGASEVYANVEQDISPAKLTDPGRVNIHHIAPDNATEAQLALLADRIAAQIAEGHKPGDITVLSRWNRHAAWVIDYLMRKQSECAGYPKFGIVSDDAMAVATSPAVKIIIDSLHRRAEVPDPDPDRLRSPRRLRRLIAGFEAAAARGVEPHEALEEAIAGCAVAAGSLGEVEDAADEDIPASAPTAGTTIDITDSISSWSLPLLIESIAASEVPEDMLRSQHVFVSALLDTAADFCSREQADLTEFLAWWSANGGSLRVSSPDDAGSIRVMTIHKAKGLEAPCVHLPFVNYKIADIKGPEWFDATGIEVPGVDPADIPPLIVIRPSQALEDTPLEQQYKERLYHQKVDELNVLYVAFTRAKENLDVYYNLSGKSSSSVSDAGTLLQQSVSSAFGVDIPEGNTLTFTHDSDTPTLVETSQVVMECRPASPSVASARSNGPEAAAAKKRTALTPHLTAPMPPFTTSRRPGLWSTTALPTPD